jgi:hypothetical protein
MTTYQYLDQNGNLVGPVSLEALRQMKANGVIGGHTKVLDEAAKKFSSLDELLGSGSATVFPAPPAKPKRFFYADINNTPVGPFTLDELQNQMVAEKIRGETQVIEEGGTVWQPYSAVMLQRISESTGGLSVPPPPPSSNSQEASLGMAIIWFLLCFPLGFMQWGQAAKGWVWVLTAIVSGGIGGIVAIIDYWMCYSAQQKRKLGEWEFFPRK